MNTMKRIAALLMALCLVFQMVPAPAGAAETAAITVSSAEAYPGNSCYIDVDAAGLSNLASLDLEIYYDSEILTLASVTNGILLADSLASVNDETVGVVKLSAAWLSGVNGSGRILRLQFQVNSDAPAGSSRILVAVGDAHDVNLNHVHISGGTGTVTVPERPDNMGNFQVGTYFPDGSVFRQGDTVTVVMTNSGSPSFASADFKLEYDSELFRVESVKLRNALANEGAVYSVNTDIAGIAKVSYASVEPVSSYFLMDFVLTVIADVDATTTVTASAADVYTVDLVPYTPVAGTGTVTLEKKPDVPDYPDLYLTDLPTTVGQEGTTLLVLDEGAGVSAADFTVKYDTAVYQCLDVTAAEGLSAKGGMVVINPGYGKGTVKFSYINENGTDEAVNLVQIRWKCLASPEEHTQVLTGATGVVDAAYAAVKLDLIPFSECIFAEFHEDPTCTEEGGEGLMCYACGEKKDVTVFPATGHSFGEWYTVVAATCLQTGSRERVCVTCGHTETEELEALGHAYENGICIRCGAPESYLEEGKCGDTLYWRMGGDGTLAIFGTGAMYDFTSSETGPWNAYKDTITKVTVSEGATTIGQNAFRSYTAVAEVRLPGSLQALNNSCFYGCSGLVSVELTGELKRIGSNAFSSCNNLETVTLPEGLDSIGQNAFSSCSKLKGIVIPDTVTVMGNYAFSNCYALEYANIPAGVTTLSTMVFYSCQRLKEITIPEGVEVIGDYAFSYCSSLTSVTVPAGVTTIGRRAFLYCSALKEIYIYSTDCTIADESVFDTTTILLCYEDSTAQAHAEKYGIPYCAAPSGTELGHVETAVVTAPTCTEQGYTTYSCSRCGNVRVGDYTDILPHAYESVVTAPTCTEQGYTTYTCPDCGDSYVDDYVDATGHNYGQWYISVESTCTETGVRSRDCENCNHIESETEAALGHAYENGSCTRCGAPETFLEEGKCGDTLYWRMGEDGTLTIFGTGAMYTYSYSATGPWSAYKDSITKVVVCEGATTIGNYAFRDYTAITEVELPDSLQALNNNCFYGCDGLTEITIPAGVQTISDRVFYYCEALKEIYIYSTDCSVGTNSFPTGTMLFCYEDSTVQDYAVTNGYSCCAAPAGEELGHVETAAVTDPTCTEQGFTTYSCSRCGNVRVGDYTDILPHAYEGVVTAPTCTAEGYTTYTCRDCGDSYVDDYVDATDHSFGQWYISVEPTCTEAGTRKRDCQNCDHAETDTADALGHAYENGLCIRCGAPENFLEEGKCGDTLYWRMGEDGTLTVFGAGEMYNFGYSETGPWNGYKDSITKVVVKDGATSIGNCAFREYTAITDVELPGSLQKLGGFCFSSCSGLTCLELTGELKQIGSDAFNDCSNLLSVTLPDGLESIGSSAFNHCAKLKGIVIPDSVSTLGGFVFCNCQSLEYANIPEGVTKLDTMAFYSCSALKEITIPESMVTIGEYAFEGCDSLTEVRIPAGVETISSRAFLSCENLKEIYVYSTDCTVAENSFTAGTMLFCYEDSTVQNHAVTCGYSYCAAPAGEELGHVHTSVVTAPTCTENGYTTHTCTRCDDSYTDTPVDALGHAFGEWYTVTAPTCTKSGQDRRDCDRCDHFETRVTAPLDHDYDHEVVDPTCTEEGYTVHTCKRCGESFVSDYVDALGHNFGSWYTTKEASCTADGQQRRDCERCDHYETQVLTKLGHDYESVVTDPTCTEDGYTTHTCTRCGDAYTDTPVAALGHSFGDWYTTKAATCTEDGQQRRDCSRCDHYETEVLTKQGHAYESVVTDPTCTEDGYTTHTCTRCGDAYTDTPVAALGHSFGAWETTVEATCTADGEQRRDCSRCDHYETEVLPKLGHAYESAVTEPTCTEQGYTTHTCSRCGDSYTDSYVPALKHSYDAVVTEPTCLDKGYTTYTCKRCGYSYISDYVNALGHSFGAWETTVEATCTADGEQRRDCSRCDHYETEVLSKLGHAYESAVTEPTCTEQGYTTHTCSRCGDTYTDTPVKALGHSFGTWETTEEATCTSDGEQRRDCDRCDYYETEVLPKLGHSYKSAVTAPTCTADGYTTHTCTRCGDTYTDTPVAALGHKLGDWYTTKAATCTEDGQQRRDCGRCDHYETQVLTKLGHDYKAMVTDPTCTEEGYTTHTCARCGDSYTDTPVAALGHSFDAWYTTREATCTADGQQRRDCSRCNHYETQVLTKLGHDYKAVVTDPTCTEKGYTTYTCSRCDDSYVSDYVDALGHNFGTWYTTKEATCTENGQQRRDCGRCDHHETQVLTKLGHAYESVVTAPTCTEDGYTTHTCSRCGDSYTDSYVPALKHNYNAVVTEPTCLEKGYTTYTCSRCGHSYVDNYVEAAGHTMGQWYAVEDATCTQTGTDRRDCERCDHFETRVSEALGHDYKSEVTDPTCTADGYTTHTCSRCDDTYTDTHVAALGHDWDEGVVIKEPTEESTGERLHTCRRCGETKTEIIPELEHVHSYEPTVTAPTCTEDGYTTYTCRCGDSYKADYVDALGHDYKGEVTDPTCTEKGYTTYTCSRCGDSYVSNYVDALGHNFGSWYTTKAATCTEDGQQRRDCDRCGHYETEVLPKLGHDYKSVVTEPTCTEDGYTTHICSRCGDSYTDSYVSALKHDYHAVKTEPTCLDKGYNTYTCKRCGNSYISDYVDAWGHDFGDWYTTKAATCTEDGQQRRDCDRCGHYETEVLPKLGHAYDSAVTAPTCTEDGYTTHTCSRCDDTYTDTPVKALGHDFGTWYTTKEASCTENGQQRRDCGRCDHYETEVLDKLGHSYKAAVTAPTCTEDGYTTHTCSRCGDTYTDTPVKALGHNFGDWYTTKAATCTENGAQRRDCGRCDHYETQVLTKLGHDYKAAVTAPTCTEDGYTTHTCSRCGDSYTDTPVAALGHDFGAWYTTKEATCTEDGQQRRDCGRCSHYETEVLPKLGHAYESEVTAPTCTEDGYTTHTCSRCDDTYTDTPVKALGHDFGAWYTTKEASCTENGQQRRDCSRCDHYETEVLSKLGHAYESVVTAPTCTEEGYTTHTCKRCADTYKDSYTEELGHSYDAAVTAPTCLDKGYTTYTCSRCGHSYVDNYVDATGHTMGQWYVVEAATCTEAGTDRRDCEKCDHSETRVSDALGHDYQAVITEPTCTADGYTTHTCSRCDDTYTDTPVKALGHDWDEGVVIKEPTEDTTGERLHTCKRCGETKTEIIPELEHVHSYESAVTAPTCTEQGYTTYTCRCGDSYKADYVDALGHDYESVITEPTCTVGGYTTHTCQRCKDTYTDGRVDALGHDYGEWYTTKAASCTEDGQQRRDCSRCDRFETEVLTKLGHDYKSVVTEPTCTEDGYTTHTCSRCGDTYTDSYVAALKHDYNAVKTEPTCLNKGYTTYTCSRCGNNYVSDYVDALGHAFGDWYTKKAATCTENGERRRDCSRCDRFETEALTKLGHAYESEVTAPTCTEDGYTTHTCKRCGDTYTDTPVAALGHDWDEGKVTVEPTEDSEGEMLYTCRRCGETRTEVIPELNHEHRYEAVVTDPTCTEQGFTTYTCRCGDSYVSDYVDALGHDYKSEVTAPTCTEDGYITHTCKRCGDTYTDTPVAALGHDYVDGVCTRCGEKDPGYVEPDPGTANVIRLSGKDRYLTAFAVANRLKELMGVEQFSAVVVAYGQNFPDALTGSYLAAVKNAPILLTEARADDRVLDYIRSNLKAGGKVYILGGTAAVSQYFEDEANSAGFDVQRLKDKNRYGTNLVILREAGVNPGDEILIATGKNYADSLSASATRLPMLLVDKTLNADQIEFLKTTSGKFVIIGGTGAVSQEIEDQLNEIGTAERVKGKTRYETSVVIAERYFSDPKAAVLAYAQGFPDGLCGGPLAVLMGAPLILTSNEAPAAADAYIEGITAGAVTGGTGRISDDTVRAIFDLEDGTEIPVK